MIGNKNAKFFHRNGTKNAEFIPAFFIAISQLSV